MRKLYAIALTTLLLASAGVMAQPSSVPPSLETPGELNSAENPYLITSVGNLLWIGDDTERLAYYYRQTDNISFPQDINTWDDSKGWKPIGGGGTDHLFTGQYDGGGYSITGLYINRPNEPNVGLFGHVGRGTDEKMAMIRNLRLEDVKKVHGGRGTGALVGRVTGDVFTLIEFCSASEPVGTATNTVQGDAAVGGLVGSNNSWRETPGGTDNPVISQSYADISVAYSGADPDPLDAEKFGGLAGCNQKGTIIDSYALGKVTVARPENSTWAIRNVGGLVGCILFRGRVERSFADTDIIVDVNDNIDNVGGLIGQTGGPGGNAGQAENSYWNTDNYPTSAGGNNVTGLSKSENEWDEENFVGFDFENVWNFDNGTITLQEFQPTVYNLWKGTENSTWDEGNNWSKDRSPQAQNDFVIIPDLELDKNSELAYPEITGTVSITVRTLNINQGANITIETGGKFTVNGSLRSEDDGIIIKSSEVGTGSLINNSERVGATVQHYVKESTGSTWDIKDNPTEWFYISHPVGTQTITTVLNDAELDGSTNRYDLYRWDEPNDMWLNYQDPGGLFTHTFFERGTGYLFAAPKSVTFTYKGELHAGEQRWKDLTHQGDGSLGLEPEDDGYYTAGWHLLGNPFPSGIVATDTWTFDNIVQTPKVWDVDDQSYKDVSDGQLIPINTAFFVQVVNEGFDEENTLTIPSSARAHEAPPSKNTPQNRILLVAQAEDSEMRQQHVIRLEPDAAEGFDLRYDSRFMAGYAPQLFSITETDRLSTITISEITDDLVIPMVFRKNHEGENFLIKLERNIPGTDLYLHDLKTETWHELGNDKPYAFTADDDNDPIRFELHFSPPQDDDPTGIDETSDPHTAKMWFQDNRLYVKTNESGTRLTIYDLNGRTLQTYRPEPGLQSYHIHLPPGAYIARLNGNNNNETTKIIIQ